MIIDFHHHFTPRELISQDPGDKLILSYDENGAPSYTTHKLLFDMDAHVAMMDETGIDVALLSCAAGMAADLERSRFVNDKTKHFEKAYPKRFIGFAHVNPLGGPEALKELARCADELGFPGVTITSEQDGVYLDAPELEPFWSECERRGLFVFVHPALKLNVSAQFDAYDLARSVGREFSLVMATIRLINSQVFDRHPNLIVQMSHLSGGIASILTRIRSYQDKTFWGTKGNERHGKVPAKDVDHYLRHNMIVDSGGFCGEINSVKTALVEIPASRIVFGTDYPQEIRTSGVVKTFIAELKKLGPDGEAILTGTAKTLLKGRI
jgi:predicted TIM-barrel fold metal-dependent hydrolase